MKTAARNPASGRREAEIPPAPGCSGARRALRVLASLFLLTLAGFGCGNRQPLFYHLSQDYVPVGGSGTNWTYTLSVGGIEAGSYAVVVDTAIVVGLRNGWQVEQGARIGYWSRDGKEFADYLKEAVFVNEGDVVVEERWWTHLKLPLIKGSSWSDTYQNQVTAYGQPIYRRSESRGQVVALEAVSVPLGTYAEAYKVQIYRATSTTSALFPPRGDTLNATEWYAPRVGLVKRVRGDTAWALRDYQPK